MRTIKELEQHVGNSIKILRLKENITRSIFCFQTGISMNALRHLENGEGATLKTLIKVIKRLHKEDWLINLAPVISINPLTMVRKGVRQRATKNKLETAPRPDIITKVYFIQLGEGPIKIGVSNNPEQRLEHLQIANPEKLKILKVCVAPRKLEKQLHRKFKSYHLGGEWFSPGNKLLNYINTL